jgi:hypothetical protein
MKTVWVFNGPRGAFPSAVFSTREVAEEWIVGERLSGTLTEYPIDVSVFDWAIANGFFVPKKDGDRTSDFIQKFSSAAQEHFHYLEGQLR